MGENEDREAEVATLASYHTVKGILEAIERTSSDPGSRHAARMALDAAIPDLASKVAAAIPGPALDERGAMYADLYARIAEKWGAVLEAADKAEDATVLEVVTALRNQGEDRGNRPPSPPRGYNYVTGERFTPLAPAFGSFPAPATDLRLRLPLPALQRASRARG